MLPVHMTEQDVHTLFAPADALASARRAFAALGSGHVIQPPRITLPIPVHEAAHLSMPCYLSDESGEVLALKAVTIFPRNREAFDCPTTLGFVVLYNPSTGQPLAFMEAEHLTSRRTAAGCALATSYLARPESSVLAVLGAGMQAAAHIEALLPLFALRRIKVYGPIRAATEAFCSRLSTAHGIEIEPSSGPEGCLENADIICATTSSSVPVFSAGNVKPGAHINAIGSYRPDMAELDAATVCGARVFVDSLEAAQRGAGELIQAAEARLWSWSDLAGELSDLVLGRVEGRRSESEITLFKSVGLAVQDATAAHTIYAKTSS
jgi:alanine dehydrogenase